MNTKYSLVLMLTFIILGTFLWIMYECMKAEDDPPARGQDSIEVRIDKGLQWLGQEQVDFKKWLSGHEEEATDIARTIYHYGHLISGNPAYWGTVTLKSFLESVAGILDPISMGRDSALEFLASTKGLTVATATSYFMNAITFIEVIKGLKALRLTEVGVIFEAAKLNLCAKYDFYVEDYDFPFMSCGQAFKSFESAAIPIKRGRYSEFDIQRLSKFLTGQNGDKGYRKYLHDFCKEKYEENDQACKAAFKIVDSAVSFIKGLAEEATIGYWAHGGTPNVGVTGLATLAFLNHGYDESNEIISRAIKWIVSQKDTYHDGSISSGPAGGREDARVYDTSMAILALVATRNEAYKELINRAGNYLVRVQNDEGEGYSESDPVYGGWGYPRENWADLSNTQFAMMAVDAAGLSTAAVKRKARKFATRCQDRKESNPNFARNNDGGFFYRPGKGKSYGSMTAAGVWTLLLSGVDPSDARLKAALDWLDSKHYSVSQNYPYGNNWLYYYILGLAKAYQMATAKGWESKHDWYRDISQFLIGKQAEDGHWPNIENEHSSDVLTTVEALLSLEVREIPTEVKRLSFITFILRSPADLHVYDPQGRHVGINYDTGKVEVEIPGATYSKNPVTVRVPELDAGGYQVRLVGRRADDYELTIIGGVGDKLITEESYSGWIAEGAVHEATVAVSAIVGALDIRTEAPQVRVKPVGHFSKTISLKKEKEIEVNAIAETGVLLKISGAKAAKGKIDIYQYEDNPTTQGFPDNYRYHVLEKYVVLEKELADKDIKWPIYMELHYTSDDLPRRINESSLKMFCYSDANWLECGDSGVNPRENYVWANLQPAELGKHGGGGLALKIIQGFVGVIIGIYFLLIETGKLHLPRRTKGMLGLSTAFFRFEGAYGLLIGAGLIYAATAIKWPYVWIPLGVLVLVKSIAYLAFTDQVRRKVHDLVLTTSDLSFRIGSILPFIIGLALLYASL